MDRIDVEAIRFVLKRIGTRLEKTLRFKEPNFEHVIHLLDKASVYLSAHNYTEYGNIDALLFDFWQHADDRMVEQALGGDSDPDGWRYVPFLAREVIVRSILALWDGGEPTIEEGVLATRKFFEMLAEQAELIAGDPQAKRLAEDLLNILEGTIRTSCAAETVNSILKPYLWVKRSFQSRETAQNFLNLFILWFNMHVFKRKKRAGQSPFQWAGIKVYTPDGRETDDWLEALGYPADA